MGWPGISADLSPLKTVKSESVASSSSCCVYSYGTLKEFSCLREADRSSSSLSASLMDAGGSGGKNLINWASSQFTVPSGQSSELICIVRPEEILTNDFKRNNLLASLLTGPIRVLTSYVER